MSETPKEDSIVKVRLIENAVLVNAGKGWLSFDTWPEASDHIGARINKLKSERGVANHERS